MFWVSKGLIRINHFFRRIYAIVLLLALVVGGELLLQHKFYAYSVQTEIRNGIETQLDYMSYQIEDYFEESVDRLETLENIILETRDRDLRLRLFERELDSAPTFLSLYYGTSENEMINGSGWIAPEDFDLRERPWYKGAEETGKLIMTQPYLNASKDYWIITLAKPLYNKQGALMGVVGCDRSLDSIVKQLRSNEISENSFVFLLNAQRELMMRSHITGMAMEDEARKAFDTRFGDVFENTSEGVHILDMEEGRIFLAWNEIGNTGWIVGHYVPFSDFIDVKTQFRTIAGVTALLALLFVGLLVFTQNRYVIKPLLDLSHDIQAISVENDISYRLPNTKTHMFSMLRSSINELLDRTQIYFESMQKNKSELEISEQTTRAILDVIPDLIFLYDQKGTFIDCMGSSEDKLLINREVFIGKTIDEIMPPDIAKQGNTAIQEALKSGEIQMFEYNLQVPSGFESFETRLVKLTETSVLAIVRDITESKAHLRQIEELSFYDQLTGLYNRRYYEEELLRLDTERNLPISLIMIDVNGLKLTNDAFGHFAGDALLKKVAQILLSVCRVDDIVARIGGDEFVILLPKASIADAEILVNRILEETKKHVINNVPLSVSMGWDTKESVAESMFDIFIRAEDHMYRNKLIESQSIRNETIKVVLETLNTKNKREKQHSENVSRIGQMIGEAMHLSDEIVNEIGIAGLMHDIGKIGISESVLNKRDALSESEKEEIMRHPEIGYQILKSVDVYSSLAEYALSHHERWNGSGYPKGTRGKEIPLIARIIAVADVYESMTADYPYKNAASKDQAFDEIHRNAGTLFDPEIVAAFMTLSGRID